MKLLFLTTIILLLLTPFLIFAALDLEQTYPTLPGGQTITTESSLAEIVLYIVGLAILISGIIALISLIFGGIKYASSAGSPEVMAQARSKINNSLLGIVILVGSFLVLHYINPQLLIMKVEKAPINTGVILLTEQGKTNLESGALVQNIILSGNARYLNYSFTNLEEEFGELVAVFIEEDPEMEDLSEANFKKFKPKYIGFFQKKGENIKVIPFPKADFKKGVDSIRINLIKKTRSDINSFAYTYNGLTGYVENPDPAKGLTETIMIPSKLINGIYLTSLDFYRERIDFIVGPGILGNEDPIPLSQNIPHPPLSFRIKSEGPGIYLYEINPENQVYFTSSVNNLMSFEFNDKADTIMIKNKIAEQETKHDYLVILYEDKNFSGNLRMFFEQRTIIEQRIGNTADTVAIKINNADIYGKVDGASSIQIFELADPEESTCKEVRLCNKEEFGETGGRCISFLAPKTRTPIEWYIVATSLLPIYNPINIPQDLTDEILHKTISGQTITSPEQVKFADEIRSLHIEGKCLVVLFENPRINDSSEPYWEDNAPGEHSEVFFPGETGRFTMFDLANAKQINKCGWRSNPCASAIAIYPIK